MITVIILTHNDEHVLATAMQSVSWADEIVVVDDHSSDATVNIANKHKATVYTRSLNDDFSAQRNFGLSKAKGEWVLFIDSDEQVTRELKEEICTKLHIPRTDVNGYYLRRTDFFMGQELRHGETAHVRLLRLARKNTGVWVRPVHEVWEIHGKVEELAEPLIHRPHETISEFVSDINQYSTMNATYLHQQGTKSSWWYILAYPLAKFIVNYILKHGYKDGTSGAILAIMMSFHSFLTRAKLYIMNRQ